VSPGRFELPTLPVLTNYTMSPHGTCALVDVHFVEISKMRGITLGQSNGLCHIDKSRRTRRPFTMSMDMNKMTADELRVLMRFSGTPIPAHATKAVMVELLLSSQTRVAVISPPLRKSARRKSVATRLPIVAASTRTKIVVPVRKSARRKASSPAIHQRPLENSAAAHDPVLHQRTHSVAAADATKWIAQQQWSEAQRLMHSQHHSPPPGLKKTDGTAAS
jgi:hypothetical protein